MVGDFCGEAGEYDLYIILASHFGWTPEQVSKMPTAFVEEILQFVTARASLSRSQ